MKSEVVDVKSDVIFPPCHLPFVHVLVLLPFPCEALGLTLTADLEASLSSPPNFHLCSSHSLLLLHPHLWGPWPSAPPALAQCHPTPLSVSTLRCLTLAPASPPTLIAYEGTAPASPWLLIRPQLLPPTSAPSSSHSSSLLFPTTSFAPFLQLLRILLCHILSSGLTPHLCFLHCQAQPLAASTGKSTMLNGSWRNSATLLDRALRTHIFQVWVTWAEPRQRLSDPPCTLSTAAVHF